MIAEDASSRPSRAGAWTTTQSTKYDLKKKNATRHHKYYCNDLCIRPTDIILLLLWSFDNVIFIVFIVLCFPMCEMSFCHRAMRSYLLYAVLDDFQSTLISFYRRQCSNSKSDFWDILKYNVCLKVVLYKLLWFICSA